MADENEVKEFSAKVPLSEYEKFKANFPQYGAPLWFINNALAEFNKQCAANPSMKELVNRSIAEMLTERRVSRS